MMAALKQFFSTFASVFLMLDTFAKAGVNISTSVDEMSMIYLEEQRHERRKAQIKLAAEIAKLEANPS